MPQRHINNVYNEGELDRKSTVAKFATVQPAGGSPDPSLIAAHLLMSTFPANYFDICGIMMTLFLLFY
jgi:hypothetical protein